MQTNRGQASWISLSDVMTGLMLVFLLIVVMILYLQYATLARYENTKEKIYDALSEKLEHEEQSGKIKVSEDLVVRFIDSDSLFPKDSAVLLPEYRNFLDGFIPKYLDILTKADFAEHIREIRIEGHTALPTDKYPRYEDLVKLSQDRARAILRHFVGTRAFARLDDRQKFILQYKLMATGFGNGRMLGIDGKLICATLDDNKCSPTTQVSARSRRVEFRIVTNAEKQLTEALEVLRK